MTKQEKKKRRDREDRLLDYIAGHKKEILRYLIVVLVGEVLRWALGILCAFVPALQPFQNGLTFLLWGLPFFVACKLWVWQQKGDSGYVWATQSLKFMMTILVVAFIHAMILSLLSALRMNSGVAALLGNLLWELLYFISMLKFVLKTKSTTIL